MSYHRFLKIFCVVNHLIGIVSVWIVFTEEMINTTVASLVFNA